MNELGNTPADKDYKPSGISRAEERALEAYPHYTAENITEVTNARHFFAKGYEQAEKDLAEEQYNLLNKACDARYEQAKRDILSKFTEDHLKGLKWIENAGITAQPIPYHKYCKDLYEVLKELLKEKYDIQGNTSI